MKDTTISEKTLELNICDELLTSIRQKYPKAFWYGPSLREEKKCGYDAALRDAEGRCMFLQFKKPLRYSGKKPKEFPYWFKIRKEQNHALYCLAQTFRRCVWYAVPLIGDITELTEALPKLRSETNFTIVDMIEELTGSEEHAVEVWPDKILVHSPMR